MIKLSQTFLIKLSLVVCLLLFIIISGCQKNNLSGNLIYLPIKYTNSLSHGVTTYQYDAQNRIIDELSSDTTAPGVVVVFEAKTTYDSNNRVLQVVTKQNGVLAVTTTYTYSAGLISVHTVTPSAISDYTMGLDNNNMVVSESQSNARESFTYDNSGNLSVLSSYIFALSTTTPQTSITYQYDNKKGVFSDVVGGYNMGNSTLGKNNVVGYSVSYPLQPSSSFTGNCAYTYNSAGYPTSFTTTENHPYGVTKYTETYTYVVK